MRNEVELVWSDQEWTLVSHGAIYYSEMISHLGGEYNSGNSTANNMYYQVICLMGIFVSLYTYCVAEIEFEYESDMEHVKLKSNSNSIRGQ